MITRNRARKALAELQQQQIPVQIQSAAFVKPQHSPEKLPKKSTSASSEQQQSAEGIAIMAKKMNVISLNSSSEEDSETDATESSQSVIDLSSSDDADDDHSDMSEDEDREESDYSEDENRDQTKSTSSTPARQLLAEEVAKIARGGDVKKLKLDDCKAYLRNYGLRVTGTKPVLIDRIKQHVELKEGGSRSYDRSTFTIDCTGDVCKGDVVVFNQKVYNKYSATAKSARQAGRRTIAGRVAKESYGAQRQQHTFTVEVLWSTGFRQLPPMKPLLVKGRNLYKRKTFRQEWADEGQRQRTLDEKHERGAAARQIRAVKQGRFKGRQGDAGRFGLEASSRKQLANPYTDTLASKELSNCSRRNVFQSAVSVHQFAGVGTSHHLVRHHTQTSANTVPLGRIRQFGLPSENGEIKEATGGTGANTVPLGRIRQFGLPSEIGEIKEATGGATTSVDKHRQWFKPAPQMLPSDRDAHKQQPYEAQNASSSVQLPGGSSRSQSRPRNSTESVRTQPPITISVSQGATSITTQSHNGKSSSSLNRPSSSSFGRPVSPFLNRPSSASLGRPVSALPNIPSTTSLGRPMSPFPNRPSSTSLSRPVSPLPNRPSGRTSSKLTNSQDGFPCPTKSCTNRGSRYCSSGVCYYCCKRKGGVCTNPRHSPQFDASQHESRTLESFHVDMFNVHKSYGQDSSRRY